MGPDWAGKDIRAVEPIHGIVADRTVGTFVDPKKAGPMAEAFAYWGPYLRLRLDGTVQRRLLRAREDRFARHRLFTDEKLHGL